MKPPKMNPLRRACAGLIALALAMASSAALAENPGEIVLDPGAGALSGKGATAASSYPAFNWEMLLALEKTRLGQISADQGAAPFSQANFLDPIVQLALEFKLSPEWGVYALSQARNLSGGADNRVFDGVDAQLLNLFLAYQSQDKERSVFAGKFDVSFGEAWHRVDGIYSGFSEDYHYQGALGLGARRGWRSGWGKMALSAMAFKRDHGITRDTWFAPRDELRAQADENGLANTPGLRSAGLSWELSEMPGVDGLRLNVDAGHVAQGIQGRRAMDVAAATLEYKHQLAQDTELRLYGELVSARGFDGRELAAQHATLSASLVAGRFVWTATGARRSFSALSGDLASQGMTPRDRGVAVALTYASEAGPVLQAGVARQHAQGLAVTQLTLRAIWLWAPH
ncbi:hypothetical protein [Herbaspirillum robiniae]|nr:hypothetical protein [Herbaspirillum robiniae]